MSNIRGTNTLRLSFGQRVRALRKERDLSQIELGQRSELDHTYIGSVERGERNISIDAMGKIAAGLGVEIGELFHYTAAKQVDPSIGALVALLEGREPRSNEMVLEVVKKMVEWKDG